MQDPDEIVNKLTIESTTEKLSIREWVDYLYGLRDAIQTSIDASEADLENEDE